MKIASDGKFVDRLIPSLISAAIAVGGMAIVFWSDVRATDRETATTIAALKDQIKRIEDEAKEQSQIAAQDRQRTAELAGDVRSVLRSVSRIETLLDRRSPPGLPAAP